MSCDEHVGLIKRLAEAMRAVGVAQYQHEGLVVILGSPPPFVDAAPMPFEDEEAQRRQAAMLFAASEGL